MGDLKTWDFLLNCIQTGAIVIGGVYTLFEYRRFRRLNPKIEFDIDFHQASCIKPVAVEKDVQPNPLIS